MLLSSPEDAPLPAAPALCSAWFRFPCLLLRALLLLLGFCLGHCTLHHFIVIPSEVFVFLISPFLFWFSSFLSLLLWFWTILSPSPHLFFSPCFAPDLCLSLVSFLFLLLFSFCPFLPLSAECVQRSCLSYAAHGGVAVPRGAPTAAGRGEMGLTGFGRAFNW